MNTELTCSMIYIVMESIVIIYIVMKKQRLEHWANTFHDIDCHGIYIVIIYIVMKKQRLEHWANLFNDIYRYGIYSYNIYCYEETTP